VSRAPGTKDKDHALDLDFTRPFTICNVLAACVDELFDRSSVFGPQPTVTNSLYRAEFLWRNVGPFVHREIRYSESRQ
jgi:hypothetical protein